MDALAGLVDLMDMALAAAPRMRAPALFQYGGKDELRAEGGEGVDLAGLPAAARRGRGIAYYPNGYHLLLRDLIGRCRSATSWPGLRDPSAPLPSGADRAAEAWLGGQVLRTNWRCASCLAIWGASWTRSSVG